MTIKEILESHLSEYEAEREELIKEINFFGVFIPEDKESPSTPYSLRLARNRASELSVAIVHIKDILERMDK